MTNDEALNILAAKWSAVNTTINDLNEYRSQSGNWKADIAMAKMAEIKITATEAGVDLSTWDGSKAPAD